MPAGSVGVTLAESAPEGDSEEDEVSGTATVAVAGVTGPLHGPASLNASFLDGLVARVHAEFGVDPDHIRRVALEVLASFASARVHAFVPILVEKRLRQTFRRPQG
ncbi:MAG: hypothetical protein JWP40_1976 [Blastococcus sp.]|jgi:hypothetical protein|nr:hypothetical protein [Blastococcus sp.]